MTHYLWRAEVELEDGELVRDLKFVVGSDSEYIARQKVEATAKSHFSQNVKIISCIPCDWVIVPGATHYATEKDVCSTEDETG